MEQLHIPAGWELISEEIVDGPCLDPVETCPRVERVYRLSTGPRFEQEAIAMFAAAGMRTDSLERICEAPERGCTVYGEKGDTFLNATVTEVDDADVTVVLQAT